MCRIPTASDDGRMHTVARHMSSAQFIGRGGQLALFDEVLADATRGHGGVVLVAGRRVSARPGSSPN